MKQKKTWLLFMLLITVLSSLTLTSCGDDKEDAITDSPICGTWENYAFIYQFNPDGTGYCQYAKTNGAYYEGLEASHFRWITSPKILTIAYDGSGTTSAHTETFFYQIKDDLMVLIDTEYGDASTYYKR